MDKHIAAANAAIYIQMASDHFQCAVGYYERDLPRVGLVQLVEAGRKLGLAEALLKFCAMQEGYSWSDEQRFIDECVRVVWKESKLRA